ncbi:sulfate transporter [Azorhizobium oxalatiphilum]|uniref:Sulfate transporter n=1 Tax=Azorhizobium oxalatiphilum TaxID=980631 RepID=A0A917C2E2_9HYPH|nr:SulP family inorganic anion transporter [Azorhizobium oxalatiphilum]GGF66699.1 sulfate transporter [Azorhizobium oxalatiphilum]
MGGRWGLCQGFVGFRLEWLRSDAMAGLAVAAVSIPSAIAYPAIAGLPPEVGIYASMAALVGYAVFGPSRQLMMGPDAATMTVVAAVLATLPLATTGDRVMAAALLAVGVGILCILASVLRLGILAAFLSRPILVGFISGVALSILIGQINRFTGLSVDTGSLTSALVGLARNMGAVHWPSVILGVAMFVLLQVLSAWRSPVPGPVVVVVAATLLSALLDFRGLGIKVVGEIPTGLPHISLPIPDGLPLLELAQGVAAIWLVSFGAGIVTARSFGTLGGFRVDMNKELIGFGASNIAAGCFGGFPVSVSDSRTAINMSVEGRSQASGLFAAAALGATLIYLNDAVRLLPAPALGAILAAAAVSLIDLKGLREIWRINRVEFAFALIGLWGAVSLGVLRGVVIAVFATLAYVLLQEMRPRDAILGRIPGRAGFFKLHRRPDAKAIPELAVHIVQGNLLFFNVEYVQERLEAAACSLPPSTSWFILDASAITQIDSTAAAMLKDVCLLFAARGMALGIAELHHEPMMILKRAGVVTLIGDDMLFDDLEDVIPAFEERVLGADGRL